MAKQLWAHMMPRDIPLFASFVLSEEGPKYDAFAFDLRVGKGQDPGNAYDPSTRTMAIRLTQLRIDVVGYQAAIPTIFEVKPDARLSALGQLLGYQKFWLKEQGISAKMAIITDTYTPDMLSLWQEADIQLFLVKPASPQEVLGAIELTRGRIRLT